MSTLPDPIAQQAADWFNRQREGELPSAQQAQFARWIAESPVHMREYLAIADTWGALHAAAAWPADSTGDLLAALRAAPANVVPLEAERPGPRSAQPNKQGRTPWLAAAAVALVVAGALATLYVTRAPDYRTARGEQRAVVLPDGSLMQLNTLSSVTVRFDEHRRRIRLSAGEAFFRVATDAARPFEVETPHAVVRALGTEFNVYNRAQGTRVAVVEGKVQATVKAAGRAAPDAAPAVALGPQQAADILKEGRIGATFADAAATAWMQRRISFNDERVDEAVHEFNRYNRLRLRVADPALAALRISGVFNADDPRALVKYLKEVQRVQVSEAGGELVLTR